MDSDKKIILHIVNLPWYSGLARYAMDIAHGLDVGNHKTVFAVVKRSVLFEKVKHSYETIALDGRGPVGTILGVMKLIGLKNRIQCIFAYTGSSFFIGSILSKLSKVPVYRVRAEKDKVKRNALNKRLHKKAESIIIPTEIIREDYVRFGIPAGKIVKISPAVDINNFAYSRIPVNNTFGIIARLDPVKGHKVLIRSLVEVKKAFKDFKLYIAGLEVGLKWDDLYKLAVEHGVADNVKYLGRVKDKKIPEIMQECRFGIVSSTGSEAVSRVALEWMSCGRPVIASSVGSLPELIRDNETGFIIPPNDPDRLFIQIRKLLGDNGLNESMGEAARKYVQDNHSPGVMRAKLEQLING